MAIDKDKVLAQDRRQKQSEGGATLFDVLSKVLNINSKLKRIAAGRLTVQEGRFSIAFFKIGELDKAVDKDVRSLADFSNIHEAYAWLCGYEACVCGLYNLGCEG